MDMCVSCRRESKTRNGSPMRMNSSRSRSKNNIKMFIEAVVTTSDHKQLPPTFEEMLNSIREGLESGHNPVRSEDATGGVYFMPGKRTETQFLGVFKPMDEEPCTVNNPRGQDVSATGEGLKKGTRAGEGAYREVAAYILDHPASGPRSHWADNEPGFAGVPPTMLITCSHGAFNYSSGFQFAKMGSLQKYVGNKGTCEEMGTARFPVHQVHAISVLDIRLANADRHAGNILFCNEGTNSIKLVPIDHGYCLPETFEDCMFDWMWWPQAEKPYGRDILKYIESLDAEKDIRLLKHMGLNISERSLRVFRIATMLLKKTAAAGFTPLMIAQVMCKDDLNKSSQIENMIKEAEKVVSWTPREDAFLNILSKIMDRYIANQRSS